MVLEGELDAAIFGAELPSDPRLKSIIPNADQAVKDWYAKHKVVPLNHMVVASTEVAKTKPQAIIMIGAYKSCAAFIKEMNKTGLKPEVGPELPSTEYRDRNGRPKLVRYWAMRSNGGRLAPTEEIDRAVWKDLASAREALTYDRDRVVLDALAGVLPQQ